MKYKRILLKLSGEALMGDKQYGIDTDKLNEYSQEIKKVVGSTQILEFNSLYWWNWIP